MSGLGFKERNPDFEARVRESFAKQTIMGLLGASLSRVELGRVSVVLPARADLCQQDGFFHAGVSATIADSAAGYAALSLFDAQTEVLSTEFKVNLLAPAIGDQLRAVATVLKPGRTLTVVEADVFADVGGKTVRCVRFLGTMIALRR
ncbi:MAG: PaaI family thioesterase [Nannocystaceae bacterium]|nr:PaaI family thioesterase [Nannocystaceae bacterium]